MRRLVSLLACLRSAELEEDDAEVLVQPGLFVRVASAVILAQLWFDRDLDPEPGDRERVAHVGNGAASVDARDVCVPYAGVGVGLGGVVLLTDRRPVLLGPFDSEADRVRSGHHHKSAAGQVVSRRPQGVDFVAGVAKGLQEQDPVEQPTTDRRLPIKIRQVTLD